MTTCSDCGRERTPDDRDYSPFQVFSGGPFGWYSGSDGELCPEDFTRFMRRANGPGYIEVDNGRRYQDGLWYIPEGYETEADRG